jgi:crotonobetaine/carnitine-CoA ligase
MCHRCADGWLFFDCRKRTEIRHNGEFIQPDVVQKVSPISPRSPTCTSTASPPSQGHRARRTCLPPWSSSRTQPSIRQSFKACATQLERNKIPSFVQVLREIPKTASEKPQDRYLIDDLKQRRNQVHEFEDYAGR